MNGATSPFDRLVHVVNHRMTCLVCVGRPYDVP